MTTEQSIQRLAQPSSSKLGTDWATLRGLLPNPSILPPHLPPKSVLVGYSHFPESISTPDASTLFSGFLFAKNIPKDQNPDILLKAYTEKLSLPPLSTDEYKSALRQYIIPTFRNGWDKNYLHEVETGILSSGKTVERMSADEWTLPRQDFVAYCTGSLPLPPNAFTSIRERTALAIPDSGKLRIVTVGSLWQHLLAPLHRLIYNHLCTRRASPIVRGQPLPSTFSSFPSSDKDTYVFSGDYEASTDNLSSLHSLEILRELRKTSISIPDQIWELAFASMTGTISYMDSHGRKHTSNQLTGQLMGNYLSFPLLCISNVATLFLAFGHVEAWRMINQGLVRINGDDIVFVSTLERGRQWKSCLPKSGFVINDTKTSVHRYLFTLNSRLFRRGSKHVKRVWCIPSKGIFKKVNVTKYRDCMAAHAAVVREAVKGCPGRLYGRAVRALVSVKRKAWMDTSVKRLAGESDLEFKLFPKDWKDAERITEFERRLVPLRETFTGCERVEKIKRKDATRAQIRESQVMHAEAYFARAGRPVVSSSNDRGLSKFEKGECMFWLWLAVPRYKHRAEEEEIWVREAVVREDTQLEFEPYQG